MKIRHLFFVLVFPIISSSLFAQHSAQSGAAQPEFKPLSAKQTKITGGILYDRTQKNIDNLYNKINVDTLKNAFRVAHDPWYAEPEFVGHYLEAGIHIYETTGDRQILDKIREIVNVIIEHQPDNGYLGTYKEGHEFDFTFSVWNENFVMKGLLAYYGYTGYEPALQAAMKCGDYVADGYLHGDVPDMLMGVNNGTQNATILDEMAHLYKLTGKKLYLDFCEYIISRLENSSIKIVSLPNTLEPWMITYTIGCRKGIEMFVLYRGLINLYGAIHNEDYLSASKNYWMSLVDKHIRVTGNGTLAELWTYHCNTPMALTNEMRPNENCVAMGWMQMSAKLFQYDQDSKYFDEFEKTLYNHLIGSQALDGHDFSYYQGNIGYKVHENRPGYYSCCRYRGMRIMAHLPRFIYMQGENELAVNLFADSETDITIRDTPIRLVQTTRYPRDGIIQFNVNPETDVRFTLLVRKPEWCPEARIKINGKKYNSEEKNGYLQIDRNWSGNGDTVDLTFEMPFTLTDVHTVNYEPSVAVSYGPVVLAIDSRYGTPINNTAINEKNEFELVPLHDDTWSPLVHVRCNGTINGIRQRILLVDYASAGSIEAGKDEFRLWLPLSKK